MSNRNITLSGGGHRPDFPGLRARRWGLSLCLMLGLIAMASSVLAAEIVEVRVGKHAKFTRVVFELDRAAGYRIERSDPTSDVAELVVSLDASTIPRRIQSSKSLIEQVAVEPSGSRAVARIRLKKSGLQLKEMILVNPARIVLDVFFDEAVPAVAKAAPTPTSPTPKIEAVPSMETPSSEEIVAHLPVITPEPAALAKEVVEAPKETAAQVAVVDEPTISTPLEDDSLAEVQAADEASPTGGTQPLGGGSQPSKLPAGAGLAAADGAVDAQLMAAASKPAKRQPRPMVVRTKPAKDQDGAWMTWALVGGGIVLLLGGGLLVARRMGGGEEVDYSEGGSAESGNHEDGQMGSDDNPFGEAARDDGRQQTLGESDNSEDVGNAGGARSAAFTEDEEKESESVVFGDSEENSMEDMEVISREQVNESLGSMPTTGGAISEEFQQMMREMNRRVESLEGRIDELVDARDRLERQVAAQTEELRVQRAAIARTQRAVRNLARPEGGEGDQEPTEPAFRDPN